MLLEALKSIRKHTHSSCQIDEQKLDIDLQAEKMASIKKTINYKTEGSQGAKIT